MMSNDPWDAFLQVAKSSFHLLPYFAIWLIGAALAIVRWKRHPRVSLLALCAFMLFAFESVLGIATHFWFLRSLSGSSGNIQEDLEFFIMIMRVINTAIYGLAWVLLLMAIFGWRNAPANLYEPEEMSDPVTR